MIILKVLFYIISFILTILLVTIFVPVKLRLQASYKDEVISGRIRVYWLRPLLAIGAEYIDFHSLRLFVDIFMIPLRWTLTFGTDKNKVKRKDPTKTKHKMDFAESGQSGKKEYENTKQRPLAPNVAAESAPQKVMQEPLSGTVMSEDEWDDLADNLSGGEFSFGNAASVSGNYAVSSSKEKEKDSIQEKIRSLYNKYKPQLDWAKMIFQKHLKPLILKGFRIKIRMLSGEIGTGDPVSVHKLQSYYLLLMAFAGEKTAKSHKIHWNYGEKCITGSADVIFSMKLYLILLRLYLIWKEYKQARNSGLIQND